MRVLRVSWSGAVAMSYFPSAAIMRAPPVTSTPAPWAGPRGSAPPCRRGSAVVARHLLNLRHAVLAPEVSQTSREGRVARWTSPLVGDKLLFTGLAGALTEGH